MCHIATVPAPKCFFNRKLFWSFSELFWLLGKKNVKVKHVMLHIVYWVNLVTNTVFWNKKVEKVVFESFLATWEQKCESEACHVAYRLLGKFGH